MSIFKKSMLFIGAVIVASTCYIVYSAIATRQEINQFEKSVVNASNKLEIFSVAKSDIESLPAPVQKYFKYVFPNGIRSDIKWVKFEQEGQFRRPLTESFALTTAKQVIATQQPDLVFSADTPLFGPIWAIAYDTYIDGKMEMEARLLSTFSVMHEYSTPTLDQISLRRWLLESPSNPTALLSGGIVKWEAMNSNQSRAIVEAHGYVAKMVATFDEMGALVSFSAEEDGDLTTPYHGSGEHVARGDYELIENVRIPMSFKVSRMAKGKLYPFWSGQLSKVEFGR